MMRASGPVTFLWNPGHAAGEQENELKAEAGDTHSGTGKCGLRPPQLNHGKRARSELVSETRHAKPAFRVARFRSFNLI